MRNKYSWWVVLTSLLAGCDGPQNFMRTDAPAAAGLAKLGSWVLIAFSAVTVVVLLLIAWLAVRRRGTFDWHAPIDANGGQRWIVVGGVAVPVTVLAIVFIASLQSMTAYPMSDHDSDRPDIRLTGRQWWFNAEYIADGANATVASPTEIHIPVGRPLDIELVSRDVIHSFWVPKLHGKVDLVPGMRNMIRIRADTPGEYWGECGEFCGAQHANMRLLVIAHRPDEFESWLQRQRAHANPPQTAEQSLGEQVFMSAACPLCHTVRGTAALGQFGPDLTHIASRSRIAGGMLVNNRANLQAWITHAQSLKPGAQMPNLTGFDGEELNALAAYLQSLK